MSRSKPLEKKPLGKKVRWGIIVSIWLLFIVIIVYFVTSILGIQALPPVEQILLDVPEGDVAFNCAETPVTCINNTDCENQCLELPNISMECKEVARLSYNVNNDLSRSAVSLRQKFCVPQGATFTCNQENGGNAYWTGWAGTSDMRWDCMCGFPQFYGGISCEDRVNNVCYGGTWNWSIADLPTVPSDVTNCTCADSETGPIAQITARSGIQKCFPEVQKDYSWWLNEGSPQPPIGVDWMDTTTRYSDDGLNIAREACEKSFGPTQNEICQNRPEGQWAMNT